MGTPAVCRGKGLNGVGLLYEWQLGSPGGNSSASPNTVLEQIPAVPKHSDTHAAPGEADQHVGCSQRGVVPAHPTVLVEQQGEGAVPVGGEDCLVGARLEKPKAPP